jgi:anthranilate synthase component 1
MFVPSREEFHKLAEKGNLIPVYREHLADMETPVSTFARFAEDDQVFLFESVEGGERWGRFSFIGIHPQAVFSVENDTATLTDAAGNRKILASPDGPLAALRDVLAKTRPVEVKGLPRFVGGAVGYIGYETVNEFERLPKPKAALDVPLSCLMLAEDLVIFDNVQHTVKVVAGARPEQFTKLDDAYDDACRRIEAVEKRVRQPRPDRGVTCQPGTSVSMASNVDRESYARMVERTKEYIYNGDIIQAVLSQRFTADMPASPLAVYRALRLINPSPYMFFLKFGDHILIGSSPEIMVRLTGNLMELRPIAGTRPRGNTEQEDRQHADELLADEKERAEHVMLVDLGRNDLGRIAMPGSVQVRDFMTIERYSHVMHIVSHVQGQLNPGLDAFDVIRATFPAGTLSGAPKIRAMEIIHELEPQPRGAYGGAVGYIGYDGNMDLAITIRTLEVIGDRIAVQAGAGIVADSDPNREYDETVNKAKGMVRALDLAARGLELHPANSGNRAGE